MSPHSLMVFLVIKNVGTLGKSVGEVRIFNFYGLMERCIYNGMTTGYYFCDLTGSLSCIDQWIPVNSPVSVFCGSVMELHTSMLVP